MITQEELNALVALLQRTPMTQAEALWTRGLVERWQARLTPPKAESDDGDGTDQD